VSEVHTRISLHKQSQSGLPPSTDAIRVEENPGRRQGIKADITAAFDSGEVVGLGH